MNQIPWTDEEIGVLKALWGNENVVDFEEVLKVLKTRTDKAVKGKAASLGLSTWFQRTKPEIDFEYLRKLGVVVEG